MRFIEISIGGAPSQSRRGLRRIHLSCYCGFGARIRQSPELCHPSVVFLSAFGPACDLPAHKSGRRALVRASASARRQAATLAWSPEIEDFRDRLALELLRAGILGVFQ